MRFGLVVLGSAAFVGSLFETVEGEGLSMVAEIVAARQIADSVAHSDPKPETLNPQDTTLSLRAQDMSGVRTAVSGATHST